MSSKLAFFFGVLLLSTAACGNDGGGPEGGNGGGGANGGTGAGHAGGFPPMTTGETFGEEHAGSYHLGPVDFAETQWHNACAPYPAEIQNIYGPYLAGVDSSLGGDGSLCDACALIKTRLGKQILVHLVTYGQSKSPFDMDLSPEAYDAIHEDDPEGTPENPRPMTWKLARCSDQGSIYLQYQTGANAWWTSFWVRNGKLPIKHVAAKGANDDDFSELTRTPDGPFTDGDGVGEGAFELRITSIDDQVVTQSFDGFMPGAVVASTMQFE